MTTRIKPTSPLSPKTNPERGLFSRKDFPFDPEAPLEGRAVLEDTSVTVTCPFGGDVGVSDGIVGKLFEYQHPGKNDGWFQRTLG